MKNLLDVQVELYPELLRRLAAGEKFSAAVDDEGEKLAAVALVVEALENEIAAEASGEKHSQEKTALIGALEGLAAGALLAGPVSKGIKALRGEPQIPEHAQELLKSFRSIIESRRAEDIAKRRLGIAAVGGAAAGALAVKALSKKDDEKAAADESEDDEKKKKLEELRAKAKEERGADKEVPPFMKKDDDKDKDKDEDKKDEKSEKSDEKKDESKSEKKDDKKDEKREEKEEEREEADEAKEGAVKAAAAPGTSALIDRILKNLK
jgi:hypothetical protein